MENVNFLIKLFNRFLILFVIIGFIIFPIYYTFHHFLSKNNRMIVAAEFGDIEKVKSMIDKGADVNAPYNNFLLGYDNRAIDRAIKNGYLDIVRLLIDKGAKINERNCYHLTALEEAVISNNSKIIKLIIERGAAVDICFINACLSGHKENIKLLISNGVNVNYKDSNGVTALMRVAESSDEFLQVAKLLIDNGADVNAKDKNGYTPLFYSIFDRSNIDWNGERDIVLMPMLLLDNGSDINAKDKNGKSLLMYSSEIEMGPKYGKRWNNGNKQNFKMLIKKGAKYNEKYKTIDGETYLMAFCHGGHEDQVKELIDKGADVNAVDKWNQSVLYLTSCSGNDNHSHLSIAKLLVESGAKINTITEWGSTALIASIFNKDYDLSLFLINKGADINIVSKIYGTALSVALYHNQWDTGTLKGASGRIYRINSKETLQKCKYLISVLKSKGAR